MKIENDNTQKVKSELESRVRAALEAIGATAETYAKKGAPVDTGRLRNSISHAVDENTVYIGTNVEYAPYQELGTSSSEGKELIKPKHFLKNAVMNHKTKYKRIINDIMKK